MNSHILPIMDPPQKVPVPKMKYNKQTLIYIVCINSINIGRGQTKFT